MYLTSVVCLQEVGFDEGTTAETPGCVEGAEKVGGHFSGEELRERGAWPEGFLEMIQVEEEGIFGFSGKENVVCEQIAVFVVCHLLGVVCNAAGKMRVVGGGSWYGEVVWIDGVGVRK